MKCVEFNNLPLSVITPAYKAYEGDVLLRTKIPWPVLALLSQQDKDLRRALAAMERYDTPEAQRLIASIRAISPAHPDACALGGFIALGQRSCGEAAELLALARGIQENAGTFIRKLYPSLRFLLRISRFQLFPVYPDYFGISLALAVALGKLGQQDEAVRVLREMASLFGWRDEMRIVAGEIALASGDFGAASSHLSTDNIGYRDDLDLAYHILKGLADYAAGKPHDAAIVLRGDSAYSRERNRYLTTVAKFIYSHALEEDGLPLLALRESASIDLKCVLSPDIRTYIKWREAKLKAIVDRLKGDELVRAADFNWFIKGSRVTEESLVEVLPLDLEGISRPSGSGAKTAHERMRRLDEVFRSFQPRAEPEDEVAEAVPPPPDFNPQGIYHWSLSQAGDEELCYHDFRGMREPPEGKLAAEARYKRVEEGAAAVGMVVLVLWLMVRCF